MIRDARAEGELRKCDVNRLARVVQATLNGSLLEWTIHREGPMAVWIRKDLRAILDPYRT